MRHQILLLATLRATLALNFPFERAQLISDDIASFPAVAFGNLSNATPLSSRAECRAFPGTESWPSIADWTQLNATLGGVLLKPLPPAAACYAGPNYDATACSYLTSGRTFNSRFYIDDPLTVLTAWPQGNTCPATRRPNVGTCEQGGFPTYVINASTVAHVQAAVNFARNRNLRLVIKNTGHDWVGRSTGAGALSIWTHHLKFFEFLPEYTQGNHSGMAARVSAGLEAWEMYRYMAQYNMTLVVPGGSTVGAYGGWMAGGGHSVLGSLKGMGSDQALSIDVVTADGRFVTADPENNADLFWALRGGGPGTFGIVTSAIVKAYPPLTVSATRVSFSTNNYLPANTFWEAVSTYYWFGKQVCAAGGTGYSYVSSIGTSRFTFSGDYDLPGWSPAQIYAFAQPFFDTLRELGINVRNPTPTASTSWGSAAQRGEGDQPGGSRFASRLFPASQWDNATVFAETILAVREVVASGYMFHGILIRPDDSAAGYPGGGGLNPAFRKAMMHADIFDNGAFGGTAAAQEASWTRFDSVMNVLRAATPGSGSYINEADVQEPDWQQSFFGSNYPRLLGIKKAVDPWGLFWAPTTVGSEDWAVRTADGLPTQDGPLCRPGSGAAAS